MNNSTLKGKMLNATKWASITEIAPRIVSPVSYMVLARLLTPEAFGVVATIVMITSFTDLLTDAGFQRYLVQHEFKDDDEKYKNANVAFWTNLGVSFFLWGAIAISSEQIAVLVGNPGLGGVITIACVQLPITSFSSIQMALYRRDFDFKTLFWVRLFRIFTPFLVTVPLALLGLGYWALIIGTICGSFSDALIMTIKSKWKPAWFYSVKILKEMLSFSIWTLAENIAVWLTAWIDVLIIGAVLNEYYLGLYKTSLNMVNSLMLLIMASTTPVLFAALSRLQNDNEQFYRTFFKVQRLVSMLVFPLGVGVYLYSDLATQILLGSQWREASGIIGIWALTSSILIVFGRYCSEVYRAKGRPKLSFLASMLHLVVLLPVCIISSKYGFWTLVFARAWIRMEYVLVNLLIMKLAIGIPVLKIVRNVSPTAISAVLMGAVGYFLQQLHDGIAWSFVSIVICTLFYFGFISLSPDLRKDMSGLVKRG